MLQQKISENNIFQYACFNVESSTGEQYKYSIDNAPPTDPELEIHEPGLLLRKDGIHSVTSHAQFV